MLTSGNRMRALERLEAVIAAVGMALVIIGGSVALLTTPAYVRAVVLAVDSASTTGLDEETTLAVAEDVRRFVVDPEAPMLPETVGGAPAFDAAAVEHLIDVREVMVPARWLTAAVLFVLLGWVAWRRRDPRGTLVISHAGTYASIALLGGSVLAVIVGAADFDGLFSWFHSLFFADGTWVFPYEALLIRVFPLPFWIVAGATWGGLVLITASTLCWIARRLRFTVGTYGV